MIIGKVIGKTTTSEFEFIVNNEIRKFEYVQVLHKGDKYILCQVIELTRDTQKTIAKAIVIGYKDESDIIKPIRTPVDPDTDVLKAEKDFIREIIKIKDLKKGAFIGKLEGQDINVYLDLKKLLTKHVAVLAKSGAGKSYSVGVLLEEIIEKNVPLLIIDPHGEYSKMKYPNDNKRDLENLKKFNIKPTGYKKNIQEYGDPKLNSDLIPFKLNEGLDTQELLHLLPSKLSNVQMAVLYSALKNIGILSLSQLLLELETEENNAKWSVISVIDHLKKLEIFSMDFTPFEELIRPGRCSILNLKGIEPVVQEIIVYKLLKDLFEERKKDKIPPMFVVVEEAHNFVPERSFGEKKSSSILRTIASEGRKFGMGLCVISQRPARIEKNVLSQCTTQIILKVTNPNDLKAVSNSVEGITYETENEIKNLPIGSALITGLVDIPLLVSIRPRKSRHGGETVDILNDFEEDIFDELKEYEQREMLPIIQSKVTVKDLILMSEKEVEKVITNLITAVMVTIKEKTEYNIMLDMIRGDVIKDISKSVIMPLNKIEKLNDCANYEKIKYQEIPYTKKLVKKKTIKEIIEPIKNKVTNSKECYVVFHKLIHKDDNEQKKESELESNKGISKENTDSLDIERNDEIPKN